VRSTYINTSWDVTIFKNLLSCYKYELVCVLASHMIFFIWLWSHDRFLLCSYPLSPIFIFWYGKFTVLWILNYLKSYEKPHSWILSDNYIWLYPIERRFLLALTCVLDHLLGLASCSSLKEWYLVGNKISEVYGLHRLLKLKVLDLCHIQFFYSHCTWGWWGGWKVSVLLYYILRVV
jgi:hypothetical protein